MYLISVTVCETVETAISCPGTHEYHHDCGGRGVAGHGGGPADEVVVGAAHNVPEGEE